MGDPTEVPKGSGDDHEAQSDSDDGLDQEAEQIEPARSASASLDAPVLDSQRSNSTRRSFAEQQNGTRVASDTVTSILSSISNPNAAIVIPLEEDHDGGEEEIDAARMERFYSGALNAISKMRRETNKSNTKIETLRDELGHSTVEAWTREHSDILRGAVGTQ